MRILAGGPWSSSSPPRTRPHAYAVGDHVRDAPGQACGRVAPFEHAGLWGELRFTKG
jgi:hypothetical protein